MKKLSRDFYIRDANIVARELIGKILVHSSSDGVTSGLIVETEAYNGPDDKAAHSYKNKRTSRTEIMFHEGGFAYVYMIYGMYSCFNVTANLENIPEAVLIRALEPLDGLELMMTRRNTRSKINLCNEPKKLSAAKSKINLCNGPGKLCQAMGITRENYGDDLCGEKLFILDNGQKNFESKTSTRINIDYAEECKNYLWRYFIDGNIYVSKTR